MVRDRSVPETWRRGWCQDIKKPCAKGRLVSGKFPTGAPPVNPWWDPNGEGLCIWAAYQPKWAANFAASLLDLSINGNNAGDPGGGSTPAWDAVNGWKFDGGNDYLTTAFIPQNDQSQSMIAQFTNCAQRTFDAIAGCVGSGAGCNLSIWNGYNVATTAAYANGNVVGVALAGLAAGNLGVAGNQGYRNGVASGGAIGGYGSVPDRVLWIGCQNTGAVNSPWLGYIQALAIYDCTLTAPQVLAVATAMAAI